jgi:hypothetical protein
METFSTASKPFLTLARCMGIFPIQFNKFKTRTARKINFCIALTWLIVQLFLFLSIVFINVFFEGSKILTRAWKIVHILEFSSLIFNFCYQKFKKEEFESFAVKIEEIDRMVSSHNFGS